MSLGTAREAGAHCNPAVLCPGSGACAINVTTAPNNKIDNGCVLNFDGRDVTLNGTLDIDGGSVTVRARNFTVASGGLIDGSPQGGFITILATGGNILVQSSTQRGINMIGQDQGGAILLDATGNVTIDGRLKVNNSTIDASGGSIELRTGGNIRISGSSDVDASGGQQAGGGSVDFLAVGRIDIEKDVLVSGGDGGDANLDASDEIFLNGRIIDDSSGGGGGGGFVDIMAEKTITVGRSIRSVGSTSTDLFGGDGGFLAITSNRGDVIVRDEITVQSGGPDGGGGEIELSAGRSVKLEAGRLNARGEGIESFAGTIHLDGDLDVTIGALVDSSGGSEGGEIEIAAGRNVEIANTLDVRARQPATFAGSVIVDAGILEGGAVTVKAAAVQAQAGRILANGAGCLEGIFCSIAGTVDLNGCDVTVEGKPTPLSTIIPGLVDASAPGADGAGGGIVIVARRLLTVGIGGTLNATATGSQGAVELVFPQSRPPILGASVITPAPSTVECTEANCPEGSCPVGDVVCRACRPLCLDFCDCGDAEHDEFEQCDTSAQGCDTGAGEVCGVTGTFRECICIATCGDGDIDVGEECDGAQNAPTCQALGFFNPDPVPCVSCAFDTSQCDPGECGDGVLIPRNNEVCDGADVGAESCVSLGFTRGALACKADCSGFNVAGCQIGVCGDNVVDTGEECDAGNANSTAPNAPCRPGCMRPRCGDGIADTALGEECDDSNANDNDPCLSGCRRAVCGDGIVCSGLSCTTGPNGSPEQCDEAAVCCLPTCARRLCSDGLLCGNLGNNGCCHPETSCNDGDPCTTDECSLSTGCSHTFRAGCCVTAAQCNDGNPCTDDRCHTATSSCQHSANSIRCDDGNACTQIDTCVGGTCLGANPIRCIALDQCHRAGTCDPQTGLCPDPLVPDGTLCDDGDPCTVLDRCVLGVCVAGPPRGCEDGNPCTDDACESGVGCVRTNHTRPCNDRNACTTSDRCEEGVCVGREPVVCRAPDQCHDPGVCDPATGQCLSPPRPDGAPCNDADACTRADTCQAGSCTGSNPVVCAAQDQCHVAGVCEPVTGACSNPPKADGIPCDDGDLCTQTDTCQTGVCAGQNPVVCMPLDQCHVTGLCNSTTGLCSNPGAPNDTACDDGNACTQVDTCQTGVCAGASPIVCTALDECHDAGTCDPATGICSTPAKVNGTSCSDGDLCTRTDTCVNGVCVGGDEVICAVPDQCHVLGVCDLATGVCSNPERSVGTACNDGDTCTENDICEAGHCLGAEIACNDANPCTDDRCQGGRCLFESNAAPCDDDDPCTSPDQCSGGACFGTFGVGSDILCSEHSLLLAPCGGEEIPKELRGFIESKMNRARKLLAAAGKGAKVQKLRAKAVKTLDKIPKRTAKAVEARKLKQRISGACKAKIDRLVQQRQQLIASFTF